MLKREYKYLTTVVFLFLIIVYVFFNFNLFGYESDKENNHRATLRTLHFDIYYPGDMIDLAFYTAKTAEKSYVYLANYLKHELNITTSIIIYTDQKNQDHPLFPESKEESWNYDQFALSFTGSYGQLHTELTHRLTHIFQNNIIFGSVPGWAVHSENKVYNSRLFFESMAEYFSSGYNEYTDMVIRDLINSTHADLLNTKSLYKMNNEFSVVIGVSFLYFIESVYGSEAIRELLLNIKDDNLYDAVSMTTNQSLKELNNQWIDFYKYRKNRERAGLGDYASSIIAPESILYSGTDGIIQILSSEKNNKGYSIINLLDVSTGKITNRIKLPFKKIKDSFVSMDGRFLVFVGVGYNSANVYLYDIPEKTIKALTGDFFTKRFPKISADNSFIVYSSNENTERDYESRKYKIVKFDLQSKVKTVLINNNTDNTHPDISPDGKKVAYISNISGIYNVYCYDIYSGKSSRLTDVYSGAFFPAWLQDGKSIAYKVFNELRYEIRRADVSEIIKDKKQEITLYKPVEYPEAYFDPKDTVLSDYKSLSGMNLFLGIKGIAWDNGFAGSVDMKAWDILNRHKLDLRYDYFRYDKENLYNMDAGYLYSGYVPHVGLGAFYKSSPLHLSYINNFDQTLTYYTDNINSENYGLKGMTVFPLMKYFRMGLEASSGYYEDGSSPEGTNIKNDIHSSRLSLLLKYDSMAWDRALAYSGTKGELRFSRDFEITDDDVSLNSVSFNFLKLFSVDRICIFSVKGSAGKIFGQDSDLFKYYIGGFNSIRGHRLFQYKGENAFLINTEIRLILLDKLILTWPFRTKFNDISIVLFADMGSAWDDEYRFRNSEGEFEDFIAGTGAGFRFMLADHVIFKLDAAWPYYYKSFGNSEIISGFEVKI